MNEIGQAIIKTLAYFEQFGRALNASELHSLLWRQKCTITQLTDSLSSDKKYLFRDRAINIYESERVYGLSEESLTKTIQRQKLLGQRRKEALKIAEIIVSTSGVISVIAMNSLVMQTITKESDLDFLIIVKKGLLYKTRLNILFYLKKAGLAKSKYNQEGKACLGYWLSEDNLDVKKYQTDKFTAAYWMATMVPLFGIEGYKKFIKANLWVYGYLPNWKEHAVGHIEEMQNAECRIGSTGSLQVQNYGNSIIEKVAYWVSKVKIMMDPEFRNSKELVVSKDTLKLHSVDKRPGYGKMADEIASKCRMKNAE
jgi:hypothetical protein